MPSAPSRFCAAPGCPNVVTAGRCPAHTSTEAKRRLTFMGHRFYNTKRWKTLRDDVRREQPFCSVQGCARLTDHVDHVVPHRGDQALFFDRNNLSGLCAPHHSEKTARGE